jgi:hypothetical protein
MSLVTTTPDVMTSAATDLVNIGSTISAANAAAAAADDGAVGRGRR